MRSDENGGSSDNYEPNSLNGPVENTAYADPSYALVGTTTGHFDQKSTRNDDYVQAGDLYRLMKAEEQDRIVD